MNNKDIEKTKKEIEYWSKHLDLDKFNYNQTTTTFFSNIAIALTSFVGFLTILPFLLKEIKIDFFIKLIIFFIITLIFIIILTKILKKGKREMNNHNLSFIIRERMLQERYEKLYNVSKEKLNEEFERIKEIYKNPKNFLIELLIKEYYKNKDDVLKNSKN